MHHYISLYLKYLLKIILQKSGSHIGVRVPYIPAVRRKCNKKHQPRTQSIRVRNSVNYIIVSKKPFMYYENVVLIKFVIYV